MAMYLGGQAVKILAPSINLFDKSLIQAHGTDFISCEEYEVSADKNTIIAKGNTSASISEFVASKGWIGCGARTAHYDSKGIKLNKGDVVVVSADITLIQQGDKSAAVRCYLGCKHPINTQITPLNEQGISETPQRLTWKIEVIYDAVDYYPIFAINSNKVKIENISVNKVKDYWRIRSGVNMGRNPKNLIPFPYQDTSQTTNGVEITVNNDGTIHLNGTATDTFYFWFVPDKEYSGGQYTFSCDGIEKAQGAIYPAFQVRKPNAANYSLSPKLSTITFTLNGGETARCVFSVYAGAIFDNVVLKPMLNEGSKALPYYYYD